MKAIVVRNDYFEISQIVVLLPCQQARAAAGCFQNRTKITKTTSTTKTITTTTTTTTTTITTTATTTITATTTTTTTTTTTAAVPVASASCHLAVKLSCALRIPMM